MPWCNFANCQFNPLQTPLDIYIYLHQVPFAWWANKKKREKEKRYCDNFGPDCDLAQNFTPDIGHSELELQRSNKNALFAVNFWSLLFGMENTFQTNLFIFDDEVALRERTCGSAKVKVKAKNISNELFTGNEEVALLVGDVKIVLMLPLTNLTNSWQTVGTQNSKLQIQTQRSHWKVQLSKYNAYMEQWFLQMTNKLTSFCTSYDSIAFPTSWSCK